MRALLVDDYSGWRQQARHLLQLLPNLSDIIEASDGIEAIQKAGGYEPDLVILDVGLPKLNGIEVAKRVRQLLPRSHIVFLTQEHSPAVVTACLTAGGLGYVCKLKAHGELLTAVTASLTGRRFVSGGVKGYAAPSRTDPSCHEVLFCSDDTTLTDGLAEFVAAALRNRRRAVLVTAEAHRPDIVKGIQERGGGGGGS